jgi:flagellar motor switch protein FliG
MNRSTGTTERGMLNYLDKNDPELAENLRNQMFVFEDIVHMSDQDVQTVMAEVDSSDLAVALKGCSEQVINRFLTNATDAVKGEIQDEMASSGPVRVRDVEEMRRRIVQMVRQMEEQGKASIVRGEGDFIL